MTAHKTLQIRIAGVVIASFFVSMATAQMPDPNGPPELRTVRTSPPNPVARMIAEKGGTGAYPAIMESDPGLVTHTVYRPRDLTALGKHKLPIIAWGNGACVNIGNRFRYFLTEIASHGYLVVAVGPIQPENYEGGPAEEPRASDDATPPPASTVIAPSAPDDAPGRSPALLTQAIDWAIKENSRKGSPYYGRIDTKKIAAMGQSCGGSQAIVAGFDPRVTTVGILNSGTRPGPGVMGASKETIQKLHGPALYMSGDPRDIAHVNANDDFDKLNKIPVFRAWQDGVGHPGTYGQVSGGSFGKVAVAWLDWQLKGDPAAAQLFKGKDCGLCVAKGWHVQKKLID